MTTFKCPGCNHSDDLSKYQCSNCRKFGVIEVVDKSSPFHCENCDLSWVSLTCPKCSTVITKKFIEEDDTGAVILGSIFILVVLYWGVKLLFF